MLMDNFFVMLLLVFSQDCVLSRFAYHGEGEKIFVLRDAIIGILITMVSFSVFY